MDELRVLAADRRRRILALVWDRELAAGDIAAAFDVSWPAISQHLRILLDAGFVTQRREGNHRYYRAVPERLGALRAIVEAEWRADLGRLRDLAEAEADADVEAATHADAGPAQGPQSSSTPPDPTTQEPT